MLDHQEHRVSLELTEPLVTLALMGLRGNLDLTGPRVRMELQDLQGLWVHLAVPVLLVNLVSLDPMVSQVTPAHRGLQGRTVNRALQVTREPQDLQEPQGRQVILVRQDLKVSPGLQEVQELVAHQETLVFREQLVTPEPQELLVV